MSLTHNVRYVKFALLSMAVVLGIVIPLSYIQLEIQNQRIEDLVLKNEASILGEKISTAQKNVENNSK